MSVRLADDAIHLQGRCLVEDAETLLVAVQQHPVLPVDISAVKRLHMAVVQVLLALKPDLRGRSDDPFLAQHLFRAMGMKGEI